MATSFLDWFGLGVWVRWVRGVAEAMVVLGVVVCDSRRGRRSDRRGWLRLVLFFWVALVFLELGARREEKVPGARGRWLGLRGVGDGAKGCHLGDTEVGV